jgi:hypothetical protein
MTYLQFLQDLQTDLKATTLSGATLNWYSEICLEDEIELKTGTTYPAIFIVPIPFDIVDDNRALYGAKVYMVDNVTRAPNYNLARILTFNKMISYAQAYVQQLDDYTFANLPITINPIVKWDANIDGIYFDWIINSNVECL